MVDGALQQSDVFFTTTCYSSDYYYDLYYGDYDDDKDYKAPGNICMHKCTDFVLDLNLFLLVLVSFSVFVSSVFPYLYLFLC